MAGLADCFLHLAGSQPRQYPYKLLVIRGKILIKNLAFKLGQNKAIFVSVHSLHFL